MSDGQTSDVRQTVFPKVRGRLYIMKGAIMIKPYNRPAGEEKQANRPCGRGNAPLFPYGDFPRRGKFALCPAFELISISKHSVANTSPSGGGAVGRRGAFPSSEARLFGFRCRQAAYKTHRRQAIPSPLNPLNPLNPMNLLNPLNPATQWLHGRYLPL